MPEALIKIGGAVVSRLGAALSWCGALAIDADGSPHAYRQGGGGLDSIMDAHADVHDPASKWVGVVTKPDGSPVVQGAGDSAPGFLVSPTALRDHSKAATDPRAYVNSEEVPYISTPPELEQLGVRLGDLALVSHGDCESAAIVADVGPHRKIGEGSIALARALGIDGNARHGGTDHGVSFLVWPSSASSPAWPRSSEDIAAAVATLKGAP